MYRFKYSRKTENVLVVVVSMREHSKQQNEQGHHTHLTFDDRTLELTYYYYAQ
jgi:hypothetical protein